MCTAVIIAATTTATAATAAGVVGTHNRELDDSNNKDNDNEK